MMHGEWLSARQGPRLGAPRGRRRDAHRGIILLWALGLWAPGLAAQPTQGASSASPSSASPAQVAPPPVPPSTAANDAQQAAPKDDAAASPPPRSGSAPSAPSSGSAPPAGDPPPQATQGSSSSSANQCVERLPSGRARPPVTETFPARGISGHVAELIVEVEHLPGERVLPGDLRLQADSSEAKRLAAAQFLLPSPESAPPRLERQEGDAPRTKLTLPLVPLPPEAGRHELVLPSIPITMARASGEVFVLCTQPHSIVVEDPIANQPDAPPRLNPEPRRQREVWEGAKQAFLIGLGALAAGALLAWLYLWWRARPRPEPPPPPPRVPWEVAEEALYDLERAGLIPAGRYDEHFERVASVIRKYLGDRYGFDGLESTSRETLRTLRAITPPIVYLPQIKTFLQRADLVKFARLTPSAEECAEFLEQARKIVHRTIPMPEAALAENEPPPGSDISDVTASEKEDGP